MARQTRMKGAFLVNASRSGSTMMSNILRQHPDILSLSELITMQGASALLPGRISGAAFWRQISQPSVLMRNLANPKSAPNEFLYHTVPNHRFDAYNCPPILAVTLPHLFENPDAIFDHMAHEVPRFAVQTRADHNRSIINLLCDLTHKRMWIERSGGTVFATSALAKAFPEAKFVVILRDGRDVTLSMQNYKPARFLIWFWKLAKGIGVDVFKPGAHIGNTRWIALVEKLSARVLPIKRILNTKPSLADTAACWSALTTSGLEQFQTLPVAHRLVMRYETVVQSPRTELTRLARFLELPENETWLDSGAGIPRAFPARYLSLPLSDQQNLGDWTAAATEMSDRLI